MVAKYNPHAKRQKKRWHGLMRNSAMIFQEDLDKLSVTPGKAKSFKEALPKQ